MYGGLGRTPGIPAGGGGGGLTIEEVNAQFIRNDDMDVVLPGTLGVEGALSAGDGLSVDGLFLVTSATASFTGALSAASVEIVGATLTDTLTVADEATFQGDVDFGGAVTGLDPSAVGLGNVDNTSDTAKPVSTATQTALDGKVAKAGDTMTGALNLATGAGNGLIFASDTNLYRSAADLLRTDDVFQPAALYSASVGGTAAANLTLCADLTAANGRLYLAGSANGSVLTWFDSAGSNGVSIARTATNTLGTSGNLSVGANLSVTGTVTGTGFTKTLVGLANVDNTSDANKPVSTATQTALDLKAPLASPTFTGTVSGITKTMVGLANVDNTADTAKPVSTATQTALDLKAPLASPTFTGTVSGVTKAMVGLSNVDDTSDANKPVSTAQAAADALKLSLTGGTMSGTIAITKTAGNAMTARVTGDAQARLLIGTDGKLTIGDGTSAGDTNLYRSAADTLRTDDTFVAGAGLQTIGITMSAAITDLVAATSTTAYYLAVTGDTNARMSWDGTGKITWGTGAATGDVTLYRGAADLLKTDDAVQITTNQSGVFALTVQNTHASGHGLSLSTPTATNFGFGSTVVGDNYYRYIVDCAGKIQWGDGNVSVDTSLYRDGVDLLRTNDEMRVDLALTAGYAAASTANVKLGAIGPSSQACVLFGGDINLYRSSSTVLQCDKSIYATTNIAARSASGQGAVTLGNVGTGSTAGILFGTDTSMYRSAADTLKTDDALIVGGSVGFYGGAATAKQSVTGSRSANAALASLLTALAAIGLITDSSSA